MSVRIFRSRIPLALAICSLLITTGCSSAFAESSDTHQAEVKLHEPATGTAAETPVELDMRCGDVSETVTLKSPKDSPATVPWNHNADCTAQVHSTPQHESTQETQVVISDGLGVIERHSEFTQESTVHTRDFQPRDDQLTVDITIADHHEDKVGTSLNVMASNIWQGGMLSDRHDHDWGEENLTQLGGFFAEEAPDVLFMVETYGGADTILNGLNESQSDREYSATRVTQRDDDNLWLFTWLEVEHEYILPNSDDVDSFHFGGARLGLPDGGHVHAFNTWLTSNSGGESPWVRTNQAATEEALDLDRSHTDDEIVEADRALRLEQAQEVLDEHLPSFVDDDAPVILGGDFNTQSHLDWSDEFADAPGHEGISLEWPVMQAFDDAGFTDTYRHANPDAGVYPGRTWAPAMSYGYAPGRIDYILTQGEEVEVTDSSVHSERLEDHQGDARDRLYPFYSDHAFVSTEMVIRGEGLVSSNPPQQIATEEPAPEWPDEPLPGTPVPPEDMSAEADSIREDDVAELAVDGDIETFWHSYTGDADDTDDPADPFPHNLTVDLGGERNLEGVRYAPRVDGGTNGLVVDYTLYASDDGENFSEVADGTLERDPFPKDIPLDGVDASHLRLEVDVGVGAFSHVAEFVPYE